TCRRAVASRDCTRIKERGTAGPIRELIRPDRGHLRRTRTWQFTLGRACGSQRTLTVIFTQIPERDRVAKCLNRRNAVLPCGPGRAVEQIGRPWLCNERTSLPLLSGLLSKSERARRQQRYPDDLPED